MAKQIHAEVVRTGFELNLIVGNVLVDVYAKCGSLVDGRRVFEKCLRMMLYHGTSCSQSEVAEEALELLARMEEEGVVPNYRTFVPALKACSSLVTEAEGKAGATLVKKRCLTEVRAIHAQVVQRGLQVAVLVGYAGGLELWELDGC